MLYARITETHHLINYNNPTNHVPLTVPGTDYVGHRL